MGPLSVRMLSVKNTPQGATLPVDDVLHRERLRSMLDIKVHKYFSRSQYKLTA